MAIKDWSTTAGNNDQPPDGIAEGAAASSVNNTARERMASTRTWYEDAQWINRGDTIVRVSDTVFNVEGVNLTSEYHVGRMVKMIGATTVVAEIITVVFAVDTVVTVGNFTFGSAVPTSLTDVNLGIITNDSFKSIAPASELRQGVVQKATDGEVTTGTNDTKFASPAGIAQAYTKTTDLSTDIETFGSFNINLTGFSPSVSAATVRYSIIATQVTLDFTAKFGTSNADTMGSAAGEVPAILRPSGSAFMAMNIRDNGTEQYGVLRISSSGTMTFWPDPGSGLFTTSGSKGITAQNVSYIK